MRIKVEREGGLAGILISTEIDAHELPTVLLETVRKILHDKKAPPLKTSPKGAADHYSYKISIQDGTSVKVIECNQYNIEEDLKTLVKYIEKNAK